MILEIIIIIKSLGFWVLGSRFIRLWVLIRSYLDLRDSGYVPVCAQNREVHHHHHHHPHPSDTITFTFTFTLPFTFTIHDHLLLPLAAAAHLGNPRPTPPPSPRTPPTHWWLFWLKRPSRWRHALCITSCFQWKPMLHYYTFVFCWRILAKENPNDTLHFANDKKVSLKI